MGRSATARGASRTVLLLSSCLLAVQAAIAQVEPVVREQPGGNVRVDVGSCRVLFDHTGRALETGQDCSRGDIGDASRAFRTWRREQAAAPAPAPLLVPAPVPAQRPTREVSRVPTRQPAPPAAPRPVPLQPESNWLFTTNAPDGGLSLRDQPERGARVIIDRIGNGERLRSYGCTSTGWERWCDVEYQRRRGWLAERYLAEDSAANQAAERTRERGALFFESPTRGIRIDRVDYGADDRICDATEVFGERCDGRSSCSLTVDNELCGDPARGTQKYARIDYRCNGRPARVIVVDERDTASLECR